LTTRLAVLGSPIAHSKSPLLHSAAYRALGLDWSYEAIEVTGESLRAFVEGLDESWRGLSLTMPLKRDVIPLLSEADETAALTGVANTLVLDGRRGFNTDVFGITEAFRSNGVAALSRVAILGGGATAASALVAAHRLGAGAADLLLRNPAKGAELRALASTLGVALEVHQLGANLPVVPDAVISTLPGHAEYSTALPAALRESAVLFDVAYDPWPSTLAAAWQEVGGRVISGIEMLTLQALAQVRIFTSGDPAAPLPAEDAVLDAMRRAVAP
jgi:shikimate dehydrogenase